MPSTLPFRICLTCSSRDEKLDIMRTGNECDIILLHYRHHPCGTAILRLAKVSQVSLECIYEDRLEYTMLTAPLHKNGY